MDNADNPWADLVEAAEQRIRRANEGDTLAAQEILVQAAIGLRGVLSNQLPDPYRRESLKFLLAALDQIAQGVQADKALGLWTEGRPRQISDDRDFCLFLAIGQELNRLSGRESEGPVAHAIKVIAGRHKVGLEATRKAWNSYGGEAAWRAAQHDGTESEVSTPS
ncbi:MAG: hypothetical protein JSR67_12895 [Proteobacteria bacterium]|nr:hypothetical protein [Pseudomonadota bacterium]